MAQIKIVDRYDGSFTLAPEVKAELFSLLTNPGFLEQVAAQAGGDRLEFTELLFQPIPYTPTTPRGMPAEYEQYLQPDYAIINVPPNFMFKAKVFQPSRLCAIYRKLYALPQGEGA
ncbi:MAG: hypothetical protein KME15_11945 [Drouetiella hepatica Uher 2000/2452]|jgi:hypothetical protein|uniref:Uncharacterized protein n=1 Tax=Drouetiella hepatica Uher 2000/2452 TaxID=904376 RepID=A0A951QCH9_9CYAN|nr:hypothetical protein [Drouetiella hepatica Uher 2000/2452]